MREYFIYKKYIDELLKNQNNTNIPLLQDIYSYKDYERILKPVLKTIYDKHKNHSELSNQFDLKPFQFPP